MLETKRLEVLHDEDADQRCRSISWFGLSRFSKFHAKNKKLKFFGILSSKNSLCLCAFTTGTCNWRQSHIVLFSSSFCCDSYNECVSRWPAVMCVRSIIGNDKLRPETWESGSVYTHLSTSRPRTTLQGDYLTRRPVNLFLVTPFGFWSMYAFRRSHNE